MKQINENRIRATAKEAAKELVDLATATAAALNATTATDIGYIKTEIATIKTMLDNKYISNETFQPIKMLVYGMTGVMMTSIVAGLMFLLIHK